MSRSSEQGLRKRCCPAAASLRLGWDLIKLALQVLEKKNASWIQLLLQEGTALRVEKHFGDVHRNRKQRGKMESPLPPAALLPPTRVPICIIMSCQVEASGSGYHAQLPIGCLAQ